MRIKFQNFTKATLGILILFTLTACNEYWWTRGQAPSPSKLVERSHQKLKKSTKENRFSRVNIAKASEKLLENTHEIEGIKVETVLQSIEETFISIESKLSYGNRPAFNQLNQQLSIFKFKYATKTIDISSFQLYLARVLFFLASELEVPAPSPLKKLD